MARWAPDTRERLERAALALFSERGYDDTTVTEIAERAGLSKATFFRHFSDKRELLSGGPDLLSGSFDASIRAADPSAGVLDCLRDALAAVAPGFTPERHDLHVQRGALITAHSELFERQLLKRERLTAVIADAFRSRGADEMTAQLAADLGVLAFNLIYARWMATPDGHGYPEIAHRVLDELQDRLAVLASRR